MKNKILKALFAVCAMLSLANCSKGSSSSTVAANTRYIYQNNNCWDTATQTYVNINLCTTSSNRYTLMNGACYDSQTQTYVQIALCNTSTTGSITEICNGLYYWNSQLVRCTSNGVVNDCRGYTLLKYGTNQSVYCQ